MAGKQYTVRLPGPAGAGGGEMNVVEVAPGVGVATGQDARTLAERAGVFHLRTRDCTAASLKGMMKPGGEDPRTKLEKDDQRWTPGPQYTDYVKELLSVMRTSGQGSTLAGSFAQGLLPVLGGQQPAGGSRVLTDAQGGDSGLRVVFALGQHGWDWWAAPGDLERAQDGTGSWALVSVPFRRTFSEGSFTITPASMLAHVMKHASQIHQGSFDPRIAPDITQSTKAHEFTTADMTVSEIEARGKRTQLVHLTRGSRAAKDQMAQPDLPERTAQSIELAQKNAESLAGPGQLRRRQEEARALLASREATARITERSVAKELGTFYQGPMKQTATQKTHEILITASPAELRDALHQQASIEKDKTGKVIKVKKPSTLSRAPKGKLEDYELKQLNRQKIALVGRDIKQWEDPLTKGSELAATVNITASKAPALGAAIGLAAGSPAGPAGMAIGASVGGGIGAVVKYGAKLTNPAVSLSKQAKNVLSSAGASSEDGKPQLQEPDQWPQESVAPPPHGAGAKSVHIGPASSGQSGTVRVLPVPGYPGVGICTETDAQGLATMAGTFGNRTRKCTPLTDPVRERYERTLPGTPRSGAPFAEYATELLQAAQESASVKILLRGFATAGPLPQAAVGKPPAAPALGDLGSYAADGGRARQLLTTPGPTGAAVDSGFRVVLAAGRHAWDWWTAPGDAACSTDGSGTWAVISLPYRLAFYEGDPQVRPDLLLGHQLTHASQAQHGRLDPEERPIPGEKNTKFGLQETRPFHPTEEIRSAVTGKPYREPVVHARNDEFLARGTYPVEESGKLPASVNDSLRYSEQYHKSRFSSLPRQSKEFKALNDLRDARLSSVQVSERTIAEELGANPQNRDPGKELYTTEMHVKSGKESLTQRLAGVKSSKPSHVRRKLTKASGQEAQQDKEAGLGKKGVKLTLADEALPEGSRKAEIYNQVVSTAVKKPVKMGLDLATGGVEVPFVGDVINVLAHPDTFNRISHDLRRSEVYAPPPLREPARSRPPTDRSSGTHSPTPTLAPPAQASGTAQKAQNPPITDAERAALALARRRDSARRAPTPTPSPTPHPRSALRKTAR
ncbi:hypothetical protein [Streptomyces yunnanensis]|uniref:Uncharacterized protein n=1 Tax=Streptomyces yunnanensis TaxID=156453 RepID=A0A9X8N993_9ACTN|nr:hypothetical protein [Streptomyces yunnanensis]SHN32310.1 hypothetical protein SAMN05216268_1362 [Streptomyces yunnanensis]